MKGIIPIRDFSKPVKITPPLFSYEVDGKTLFTETVRRIADRYADVLEELGDE